MASRRTILASATLIAAVALACGPAEPRNVLLLVVDTLRADHTSLLGYARATTPELDTFARDALVFENARASSSWTKPSMASLLTGLSAAAHGVENAEARLPEAATTLAEVLWSSGYRTALFSDNPYVSRPFGFAQGYEAAVDYATGSERSDGSLREHAARDWARRSGAATLNARLLAWLDADDSERRWFAHVHYMEPHWPYRAPPAFYSRFAGPVDAPVELVNIWGVETGLAHAVAGQPLSAAERAALIDAYDGAVAYWDDRFGALIDDLEQRGRLDDTLVVVTSDHGEAFYEHATWVHQNSLYDELVRVPIVLRGPGIAAGRDSRHVSSVDLASTVLALTGLDGAGFGSGRSLVRAGSSGPSNPSDPSNPSNPSRWTGRLEHEGRRYHAAIEADPARPRAGPLKWIVSQGAGLERIEAFDIADDSAEARDRSSQLEAHAELTRRELLARAETERSAGLAAARAEVSEQMEAALRALGYAE